LIRRRTLVSIAAIVTAAILVAIAGVFGDVPGWDSSPNAVARTGATPAFPASQLPPYAFVPYGNELALTPPMGWNGYNHFGRDVSADVVRAMARALVTSGMKALGYDYVNLDGGWDLKARNPEGELQPDPKKFPQGIKPVADYVHALGLKFGIYTSAGYKNCANTSAGSFGHYVQDAAKFASWGVDYVKLDWCFMPVRNYPFMTHVALSEMLAKRFGDAILASGPPRPTGRPTSATCGARRPTSATATRACSPTSFATCATTTPRDRTTGTTRTCSRSATAGCRSTNSARSSASGRSSRRR
jgi:hypothetical protein